jgi:transforming growth factor-beta-induced protein
MRKPLLFLMLALIISMFALPLVAQSTDIVDTAAADGRLNTFVAALQASGLDDELRTAGPFTVFAPTDEAFEAALAQMGITQEALMSDPEQLRAILSNHIVPGMTDAASLAGMTTVTTLDGATIPVTAVNGSVMLNNTSTVVGSDIAATNGVIHVIDQVLMPSASGSTQIRVANLAPDAPAVEIYLNDEPSNIMALNYGDVSTWVQTDPGAYRIAVVPAGETATSAIIGPVDVPLTPGAWSTLSVIGSEANGTLTAALISQDVELPLADGSARLTVFHAMENGPAVDVIFRDGPAIIQNLNYTEFGTIDVPAGTYDLQAVASGTTQPALLDLPATVFDAGSFYFLAAAGTTEAPTAALTTTTRAEIDTLIGAGASATTNDANIVAALTADGEFTTLLGLLQTTALDQLLSGTDPMTLFAPTDAAFAALPAGTLDSLSANPDQVRDLLLYHVVASSLSSSDLLTLGNVPTVQGGELRITSRNGTLVVNEVSTVTRSDMTASNGVIHVIDTVLSPPASQG